MLPRHQDKEPVQRSPALICFRLVFFLLVLFAACSSGRQDDGENGGQQNERFFPAFSRPSTLQAIRTDSLDAPTLVMIQTLQGILAQSRPEIYIDEPGTGYSIWLRDLAENFGIDHTWHEDPWWFVDRYRDRLAAGGTYILYDMGEESENVATSLAGFLGSVAVASEIEAAAREHGLSPALDVRGRTERWLFENYSGALNRDFYLFQRTSSNGSLREYPAATNSFLFHMACCNRSGTGSGLQGTRSRSSGGQAGPTVACSSMISSCLLRKWGDLFSLRTGTRTFPPFPGCRSPCLCGKRGTAVSKWRTMFIT